VSKHHNTTSKLFPLISNQTYGVIRAKPNGKIHQAESLNYPIPDHLRWSGMEATQTESPDWRSGL